MSIIYIYNKKFNNDIDLLIFSASFGGLLGLFAGFSLMSIFEFLYFFIIRVIIDTYMNLLRHSNTY